MHVEYSEDGTRLIKATDVEGHFVVPDTVVEIGESAFEGCNNLVSIDLPYSVTHIADQAFSDCASLKYLSFSERLVSIGDCAFQNCEQLEMAVLPDSLKVVGKRAFYKCVGLSFVDIPTGTKLGYKAFKDCPMNIVNKRVEVDWKDVSFGYHTIYIPDQLGREVRIEDEKITSSMEGTGKIISKLAPKLIVQYRLHKDLVIENAEVLHNYILILTMKNDIRSLVKAGKDLTQIIDDVEKLDRNRTRLFVPRDKSPFVDFVSEKHAIDSFPIVPVEEFIDGGKETGALFTLMNDGKPYIVWENYKDSRATFIFKCTTENYKERRQLIFDFIMTESNAKRQFLHTDECKEIFGEKPISLVHNNFASWSKRLMEIIGEDNSLDTNEHKE